MPDHPPVITPEEWERGIVDRPPYAITLRDGVLQVHGIANTVYVPDGLRPGLAALALHGQPFGFTRRGVSVLRAIVEHWAHNNDYAGEDWRTPLALAEIAKAEALLPPEDANG